MELRSKFYICLLTTILISTEVFAADYCALGQIEGNVCTGFVIESCEFIRIDAIKGDDGQLLTVNKCYSEVSEYSEDKGMCWINTKSKNGGVLSWAVNAASQPEFLHKNENGKYKDIDVEYLAFKCAKR